MKSTKFVDKEKIEYLDLPEPQITDPDEIKIKVKYCGICGSDLSAYLHGATVVPSILAKDEPPYTHGHEFSGEVVAIGSKVTRFKIGDRVTGEPLLYCGECDSCKEGYYNACEHVSGLGYSGNGAFAEYLIMKEKSVHHIPDEIDDKLGTLIEPSAVSYGAVVDSGMKEGDTCVVFGMGPIGIMAMQAANALKAKYTIAVDINDDRLAIAKKMGATYTINGSKENVVEKIKEITKKGCDIAIEAAGTETTFNQALESTKSRGTIQCVAMYYQPLSIHNPYAFNTKELTLKMSQSAYIKNRFEKVIELIATKQLYPELLLSKEITLDHLDEGMKELVNNKSLYKVIVKCSQ